METDDNAGGGLIPTGNRKTPYRDMTNPSVMAGTMQWEVAGDTEGQVLPDHGNVREELEV